MKRQKMQRALLAAFPYTIPVLTGFLFLGIAYGVLMADKGYGPIWSFLFSAFVYAGSAQFVAIDFLTSAFQPLAAFLMAMMVSARQLFYGLSLLEEFKDTGKYKPLLIFLLCDETFSLQTGVEVPEDVDPTYFRLSLSLLNYFYWILGAVLGGLLGNMITFNTEGLDFVLTALFVVIFTDQWKKQRDHRPALIGLCASIFALILFGQEVFILPAMGFIVIGLFALKKWEEREAA